MQKTSKNFFIMNYDIKTITKPPDVGVNIILKQSRNACSHSFYEVYATHGGLLNYSVYSIASFSFS